MSGEQVDGEAGSCGNQESSEDDRRLSRRRAIQKAAAAAAASGAVWMAPKVEGLSVVPDYAAALTGSVGPTLLIVDSSGPGPTYGGSGCDGTSTDYLYVPAQPAWTLNSNNRVVFAPGPTPTNPGVPPGGAAVVVSRTLPGVGSPDATVTITFNNAPSRADRDAPAGSSQQLADITFSGIDPPFNNCRVEFANFTNPTSPTAGTQWKACPNTFESASNTGATPSADMWLTPQPYNTSPPTQRNPVGSFSVQLWTTIGHPVFPNYRDVEQIRLNVRCD